MSEKEKKDEQKKAISRREFLKDAGLVAGGIGTAAILSACSPATSTVTTTMAGQTSTVTTTKTVTPAASTTTVTSTATGQPAAIPTIKLTVNGKVLNLTYGDDAQPWVTPKYDVYSWDTLLWTLREKLHLIGTKLSCGRGACGTCAVLVNGKLALACMTLTADCNGKEVTTVEGLGTPTNPGPIQQAFIENNGAQCGYCTPGMIMAAKALLDKNPNPTEDDVKWALAGNLCRCGNYRFIGQSVLAAAAKLKK